MMCTTVCGSPNLANYYSSKQSAPNVCRIVIMSCFNNLAHVAVHVFNMKLEIFANMKIFCLLRKTFRIQDLRKPRPYWWF